MGNMSELIRNHIIEHLRNKLKVNNDVINNIGCLHCLYFKGAALYANGSIVKMHCIKRKIEFVIYPQEFVELANNFGVWTPKTCKFYNAATQIVKIDKKEEANKDKNKLINNIIHRRIIL